MPFTFPRDLHRAMHKHNLSILIMADEDLIQDATLETPVEENIDGQSKTEEAPEAPQIIDEAASVEDGTSPQEAQNEDEKTEQRRRSEEGRVSKLEKERNAIAMREQAQRQQQQAILKSLDRIFVNNPDAYETWRQGVITDTGVDFGSHDQVYKGTGQQIKDNTGNTQQLAQGGFSPSTQQGVTPDQVYYMLEEKNAYDSFIEKHPNYDPREATDTYDVEVRKMDLQTVRDQARILIANASVKGRTLSLSQAMERAHNALSDDALDNAKEDGRLVGKQEAYAKASSATSTIGGKVSSGDTGTALTEAERAIAKTLKVSEEDYLAQKLKK